MSIDNILTRFLVQEHLRSSLAGKRVLTLGRQSILLTFDEALEICASEGYVPPRSLIDGITVGYDTATRGRRNSPVKQIDDKTFFALFGIGHLDSLDHGDIEGASIVHDLNMPVPEQWHAQYDYIIDGGTFDHLVDIKTALQNVVRMLKNGGRLFLWNACSNYTCGNYFSFSPAFFADYFTANDFINCQTYISEMPHMGMATSADNYIYKSDSFTEPNIVSRYRLMVIFFARKREDGTSTDTAMPICGQYRKGGGGERKEDVPYEDFCLCRNGWRNGLSVSVQIKRNGSIARRLFGAYAERKLRREPIECKGLEFIGIQSGLPRHLRKTIVS